MPYLVASLFRFLLHSSISVHLFHFLLFLFFKKQDKCKLILKWSPYTDTYIFQMNQIKNIILFKHISRKEGLRGHKTTPKVGIRCLIGEARREKVFCLLEV